MYILDECLDLAKVIKENEEDIIEHVSRYVSPKGLIVSDMPRGGGAPKNAYEEYLIKLDKLEKRKNLLIRKLDSKWQTAVEIMKRSGVTNDEEIWLMKFRFYHGLAWKKCCAAMRNEYPESNWNLNKVFRAYRSVLCKYDSYYAN